jgi:hypothetical protein
MRQFTTTWGETWSLVQPIGSRGYVMQDESGSHLLVNKKQFASYFKEI